MCLVQARSKLIRNSFPKSICRYGLVARIPGSYFRSNIPYPIRRCSSSDNLSSQTSLYSNFSLFTSLIFFTWHVQVFPVLSFFSVCPCFLFFFVNASVSSVYFFKNPSRYLFLNHIILSQTFLFIPYFPAAGRPPSR